jgi:hypothetical protein
LPLRRCSRFAWGAWLHKRSRVKWVREQALPRVNELAEKGSFNAAFNVLQQAEAADPANPEVRRLWGEVSREISLMSNPPGAEVFRKDLDAPETDWRLLGRTPAKSVRVPRGYCLLKFTGPDIETSLDVAANNSADQFYRLSKKQPQEPGMLFINPSMRALGIASVGNVAIDRLPPFWLDRYEVTNSEYKEFIRKGGYLEAAWWKHGAPNLSSFRDTTGRPGPATWEGGTYPAGGCPFNRM